MGAMGGGDGHLERRKKRRSRWATDETVDKTIIPGMPTVLPSNLNKEQERQYICKFYWSTKPHALRCVSMPAAQMFSKSKV